MKGQKKTTLVIGIFLVITLCFFTIVSNVSMAKTIELKVSSFNPPHIPPSRLIQEWGKTVEERTGGKVKFTFYWAGSLVKMEDTFRAIQTGLADVGFWLIGNVSGLTPLNEYISLDFLGFKDLPTLYKVFKEMQKARPELAAEFEGMRLLYAWAMPPHQLHTTKKPVRIPDDIRGMKIMGDAHATDFLNAVGAVAVAKGPPDWYMSIQKGLVEGHLVHFNVVRFFKLEELFRYHTMFGETGCRSNIIGWWMNNDSFEKLPSEVQKIIMDTQLEFEEKAMNDGLSDLKVSMEMSRKSGHPILELTPQEREKWIQVGEKLQQEWVSKMEAKGKPGRAILEEAKRMIAKYNQE